jgi:hypothetical protein
MHHNKLIILERAKLVSSISIFPLNPRDQDPNPGAVKMLSDLAAMGWTCAVIANPIGREFDPREWQYLFGLFPQIGVAICSHDIKGQVAYEISRGRNPKKIIAPPGESFKKPADGMILWLATILNIQEMRDIIYVGGKCDRLTASAAGVRFWN